MILAGLLATALLAPPAHASGSATLTVAPSWKARVAVKAPATINGRKVTFPLDEAAAGSVVLQARGALQLRARGRSVTLGAPQLVGDARITALLGGQRTTVLTRNGTQVKLAPTAARTLARRLRLKSLPRTFGTLIAAPSYSAAALPCRATIAGGPAPDPGRGEPPVKARPAGAIAITSATVTWHVRESFIQYMASGEGASSGNGAQGEAPTVENGSSAPLVYGFTFPFAGGWCDPATGAARLTFGGTVGFRYRDHGIDLAVNDPEVELDGPGSRVVFRMTGSGDTDGGNRRSVVETLDVSQAAAIRTDGKTFSYERIPARVPPGAADSVFAGYYLPGDPFGWVTVTFTTA
jgi:hypothetical protein